MDERCCLGGVGLVLALRDAQRHGEAEQHESKDTDGKANEQHGRYCIRKNDCRKPRKPLNKARCVRRPSIPPTWSALPRSPATAIRSICQSILRPKRRSARALPTDSTRQA